MESASRRLRATPGCVGFDGFRFFRELSVESGIACPVRDDCGHRSAGPARILTTLEEAHRPSESANHITASVVRLVHRRSERGTRHPRCTADDLVSIAPTG